MRSIGSVVWFVFGGAITALLWLLGAAVFALPPGGRPLARAAVDMARLTVCLRGKEIVHIRLLHDEGVPPGAAAGPVFGLMWMLTFGLALSLTYLVIGAVSALTVVGVPLARRCVQLAGVALWPSCRRVISTDLATVDDRLAAVERFARARPRQSGR